MTGHVGKETQKASTDAGEKYNATNSRFGTLSLLLTNLIKCIFFDSRVKYQA